MKDGVSIVFICFLYNVFRHCQIFTTSSRSQWVKDALQMWKMACLLFSSAFCVMCSDVAKFLPSSRSQWVKDALQMSKMACLLFSSAFCIMCSDIAKFLPHLPAANELRMPFKCQRWHVYCFHLLWCGPMLVILDWQLSCLLCSTGIILCMHPANGRRRYIVTSSPIGWVHTQKDPWWHCVVCYGYAYQADQTNMMHTDLLLFIKTYEYTSLICD